MHVGMNWSLRSHLADEMGLGNTLFLNSSAKQPHTSLWVTEQQKKKKGGVVKNIIILKTVQLKNN